MLRNFTEIVRSLIWPQEKLTRLPYHFSYIRQRDLHRIQILPSRTNVSYSTVQGWPLYLIYLFWMYSMLFILPRLNCTQFETRLRRGAPPRPVSFTDAVKAFFFSSSVFVSCALKTVRSVYSLGVLQARLPQGRSQVWISARHPQGLFSVQQMRRNREALTSPIQANQRINYVCKFKCE